MKPAIFNTEMVRAILDGRKTQTRRVVNNVPNSFNFQRCGIDRTNGSKTFGKFVAIFDDGNFSEFIASPYKVGDIIYVRETWTYGSVTGDWDEISGKDELWVEQTGFEEKNKMVIFKADMEAMIAEGISFIDVIWKPSIHMPKEYARLFLRVKDVRIERLNEIEYDDVLSEGFPIDSYEMKQTDKLYSADMHGEVDFEEDRAFEWFTNLWESIYGKESFDNRYVWVIEFERISKEEAQNDNA